MPFSRPESRMLAESLGTRGQRGLEAAAASTSRSAGYFKIARLGRGQLCAIDFAPCTIAIGGLGRFLMLFALRLAITVALARMRASLRCLGRCEASLSMRGDFGMLLIDGSPVRPGRQRYFRDGASGYRVALGIAMMLRSIARSGASLEPFTHRVICA